MIWILYVYLIIAGIAAIAFFTKSLFEITKNERKSLRFADYVGGCLVSIIIIGLLWPVSWPLWFSKE